MARTASGADCAISAANAWAAERKSSIGTSWSTSPMASASSPLTRRARYSSSSDHWWPTISGNVTLRPNPWWKPSLAKTAEKRASGDATRKSAEQAMPSPAPTAAPWMAAIIGTSAPSSMAASS